MISFFLTLTLGASMTPLNSMSVSALPAQAAQEQKLELYSIEEFIDTKFEQKRMFEQRMAVDLLKVAMASNTEKIPFMEEIPLLGAIALMDAGTKSEQQEIGVDSAAWSSFLVAGKEGPEPFQGEKDLMEYLTTYMQPPYDKSAQSLKVQRHAQDRLLLAYLLPEQHKWVADFFDLQRQCSTWQAMVSASVYVFRPEDLKGLKLKKGDALPLGSAAEIKQMRDLIAQSNLEMIHSPKILALPGKEAEIVVKSQISYLRDWHLVTVYPGPAEIADPQVEVVEEGLELKTRALQIGPNTYGLSVAIQYSKVRLPIPTHSMKLGGRDLQVALPELHTSQIETTLSLPSGGGAAFRLPSPANPDEELLMIVEFQPVKTN
ncbi:MAG: hypothetical protein HQ519_04850 [Planctomycetes bacterium]|nr:hypothetical protein [Planctomycetota bacterium]